MHNCVIYFIESRPINSKNRTITPWKAINFDFLKVYSMAERDVIRSPFLKGGYTEKKTIFVCASQ
jgi:hypothetical protein